MRHRIPANGKPVKVIGSNFAVKQVQLFKLANLTISIFIIQH